MVNPSAGVHTSKTPIQQGFAVQGKTNRRTRALERMREREGMGTNEWLPSSPYIGSRRKAKSPLVAATFSEELQLEL